MNKCSAVNLTERAFSLISIESVINYTKRGVSMSAYKKEVWFTIIMSALFLVSGHMGLIFSLFPVDGMLFGFPIMYIVPILVGWFGVLILTIIAGKMGNHIDQAIEDENAQNQSAQSSEKGAS
ncbi:hypothetical protein BpOF4_12890 [Alkalihalophilus pseudofirmus OF4]|uniref:DUF997 family protein n=3 Tax=Alkalihalophilus TaxID=2893060 RepID=D3FXB8_ALKPO|nr:hypothetical protein BpOF4_12890 [Alkalihalophilus pseudofirmus OF4]